MVARKVTTMKGMNLTSHLQKLQRHVLRMSQTSKPDEMLKAYDDAGDDFEALRSALAADSTVAAVSDAEAISMLTSADIQAASMIGNDPLELGRHKAKRIRERNAAARLARLARQSGGSTESA
jgi:hypothetical protein